MKPARLAWIVLLAGAFGVTPLLTTGALLDPVRYPQLIGLVVFSALALVLFRDRASMVRLPKWLGLLLLGWLGLHLVGFVRAINLPEAIFETGQAMVMVAFFLLLRTLIRQNDRYLDDLAKVAVIGGGVQAMIGLLQHLGIDLLMAATPDVVTGTHANPNQFGSAMLLLSPFVIWALLRLRSYWRVGAGLSLAVMLLAMYLSGSRAVWLTLVIWAGMVVFMVLPELWREHRRWFWPGAGAVLLVFALVFIGFRNVGGKKLGSYNFQYLWEEGVMLKREHNSLEHRFIVWNRSVDLIGDHPLLGVGPGNWKVRIPGYGIKGYADDGTYGMEFTLRPHNDWLAVGGEMGIPGMLIWTALLFGGWGYALRSALVRGSLDRRRRGQLSLLALTGFIVVASFSFPRERIFQSMLMWTWLAIALESGRGNGAEDWEWGRGWRLVLGVVFIVVGVITGIRIQGEGEMKAMMDAKAGKNWPLTLELSREAGNPLIRTEPVSVAPSTWYEGMALLSTGKYPEGLKAMQQARATAPYHLAVRTNLAAAYAMNGQNEEAKSEYEALLKVFPDFEESWLNLAIVNFQLGDLNEVRECLQRVGSFASDPRFQLLKEELARLGN